MRGYIASAGLLILFACGSAKKNTASVSPLNLYETIPDAEEKKTLKGILTEEQIMKDTAFGWYASNLQYFKADSAIVKNIRAKTDKIHVVIFGGTWCHDTQQVLPKYLTMLNAANFPENKLTLIGVDRAKTTVGQLHKAFNITNVPTLIVLQDGKEVGRIVEYGTSGLPDKELGELINKVQ